MKITIDTDLIQLAKDQASQVALTPDASKTIASFDELKNLMEEAEKDIKEKIKLALATEGLTAVTGEGVKISLYPYGSRYSIDEANIDKLPKDWYEVKTSYKLDSDKVENYVKEKNELPLGVIEPERSMTLRITVKPNGS